MASISNHLHLFTQLSRQRPTRRKEGKKERRNKGKYMKNINAKIVLQRKSSTGR
jgi:hypothetical protein